MSRVFLDRVAHAGPLVCAVTLAAVPLAYLPVPDAAPAVASRALEVPKELLVKAGAALLVVIAGLRWLLGHRLVAPPPAAAALLLAFTGWYLLAAAVSPDHAVAFAAVQQITVFVIFAAVVAIVPGVARAGLVGLAIAGVITGVMVTIQELGGTLPGWQHVEGMVSPAATFMHRNRAAYLIALAIPLALAWRSRWMVVALAPALFGLVATRSRGAWLCALVGVIVVLALGDRDRGRLQALARRVAALAVAAALVVVAWPSRPSAPPATGGYAVETLEKRALRDYGSLGARWRLWGVALAVTAEAPLFGAGPGQFDIAASRHHGGPPRSQQADNELFSTASEAGVPAAVILLLLAGFAAGTVIAGAARDRRRYPAALTAVTLGLIAAAVPEAMIRQGAYSAVAGLVLGAAIAGLQEPR